MTNFRTCKYFMQIFREEKSSNSIKMGKVQLLLFFCLQQIHSLPFSCKVCFPCSLISGLWVHWLVRGTEEVQNGGPKVFFLLTCYHEWVCFLSSLQAVSTMHQAPAVQLWFLCTTNAHTQRGPSQADIFNLSNNQGNANKTFKSVVTHVYY